MIDTYFVSPSEADLASFCASFVNAIGPVQGRSAIAEQTLDDGTVIPAQDGAGNPSLFYACVRGLTVIAGSGGVIACDSSVGAAVCGVWAE
jgi:hypothetical protein